MRDLVSTLAIAGVAVSAHAEDTKLGWSGEGSASAGFNTGNTETLDAGLSFDVSRHWSKWLLNLEGSADYSETDDTATRERYFGAFQLDREANERFYYFVRSSYEVDEFSGFDSRVFAGAGVGFAIFKNDQTNWKIDGGPGYRIDNVADVVDEFGVVVEPGGPERSISARGASLFSHAFNENVEFTNNSNVTWAEETTQLTNTIALTSQLVGGLSGRVSFNVRHDTNPPAGFESTDTATRVSLVYTFGE
ncbi:MAG: DUF481 domain-containing protein [Pseudomonadota bacterium]